jgi:hypothetical protein
MSRLDLYPLFLLGFLGTGHCIGMCGPIVLAVPTQGGRISSHVLYNLGRITTAKVWYGYLQEENQVPYSYTVSIMVYYHQGLTFTYL